MAGGDHPPAAVASLALAPAGVETPTRPELNFSEIDGKDARDRADKPNRVRSDDYLNDAVGSIWYVENADSSRVEGNEMRWIPWELPADKGMQGARFHATRFYWHKRVAVDFPRDAHDVRLVEAKRSVLRGLRIAYIAVLPGESLTPEEIQERIGAEWRAIRGEPAPVLTATATSSVSPAGAV